VKRPRSTAAKQDNALKILRALKKHGTPTRVALDHSSPLQLLIATILSAQCTDERVNMVTAELFRKRRSVADFATVDPRELERDIHSTGFFRAKAKNIIACCQMLLERYGGEVPDTLEELTALPGVGEGRRHRGRHPRQAACPAHGTECTQRSGKDRSGSDEDYSEEVVDRD
jgi:endonuclease-3